MLENEVLTVVERVLTDFLTDETINGVLFLGLEFSFVESESESLVRLNLLLPRLGNNFFTAGLSDVSNTIKFAS